MPKKSERSMPALGAIAQLFAFKCNLLAGFVIGLIAPVAAIGAMVALIRLMTGKVPFLAHIVDAPGDERQLSLALIPLDQVSELFAQHRQRFGDGLGKLRAEMQTIAREAKAQTDAPEVDQPPA